MKVKIIYDSEVEKVFIEIEGEKRKEIDYSTLLVLTNKVLDENITLNVDIEGFDNAPDIGANYKKMFDEISKLKDDKEIQDLKSKLKQESKSESNNAK